MKWANWPSYPTVVGLFSGGLRVWLLPGLCNVAYAAKLSLYWHTVLYSNAVRSNKSKLLLTAIDRSWGCNHFCPADRFQPGIILRTGPQQNNECFAHANFLQLVCIMALIQWEIWACFAAVRCSDLQGLRWWMAPAVCSLCQSFYSHFWTNLALVLHARVTISSRTGIGPRPSVCRHLNWGIIKTQDLSMT